MGSMWQPSHLLRKKEKKKKERVFLNAFQVVLEFRSIPYTPFTPKLEHVQNLF